MGLFDFFSSNPSKKIDKAKRVMLNEHHQQMVRQEAIQELAGYGTDEAISALIERLGVNFRDTIKNEQERHWVRHLLIDQFGQRAVGLLKQFISEHQCPSGAIIVLRELIPEAELTDLLLDTLCKYEPKDHRSVEARLQLIDALDEQPGEILDKILPYVMDHSDDMRIKVINLVEERIRGVQGDHSSVISSLIEAMIDPYASGRITRAAANSLIRMKVNLTEYADQLEDNLPDGYSFKGGFLKGQ